MFADISRSSSTALTPHTCASVNPTLMGSRLLKICWLTLSCVYLSGSWLLSPVSGTFSSSGCVRSCGPKTTCMLCALKFCAVSNEKYTYCIKLTPCLNRMSTHWMRHGLPIVSGVHRVLGIKLCDITCVYSVRKYIKAFSNDTDDDRRDIHVFLSLSPLYLDNSYYETHVTQTETAGTCGNRFLGHQALKCTRNVLIII